MTEAQPLTGAAGGGEAAHLVEAKLRLSLSAHHFRDAGIADIAQAILGKDEVVTTVQVATGFDNRRVAAGGSQGADARHHARMACQGALEKLHEEFAHVLRRPFVENGAEEVAPFLRTYGPRGQRGLHSIAGRG